MTAPPRPGSLAHPRRRPIFVARAESVKAHAHGLGVAGGRCDAQRRSDGRASRGSVRGVPSLRSQQSGSPRKSSSVFWRLRAFSAPAGCGRAASTGRLFAGSPVRPSEAICRVPTPICGMDYVHVPALAPRPGVFDGYKKSEGELVGVGSGFSTSCAISWIELFPDLVGRGCLLCSEHPRHRRLVAEYLRDGWGDRDRSSRFGLRVAQREGLSVSDGSIIMDGSVHRSSFLAVWLFPASAFQRSPAPAGPPRRARRHDLPQLDVAARVGRTSASARMRRSSTWQDATVTWATWPRPSA